MVTRRATYTALARTLLSSQFIYENAKTILFCYVVLTQSIKVQRHLRARGIAETIREFYRWISQVNIVNLIQ